MSNKEDRLDWDEGRLVTLLKEGDEEAFRLLIRRYKIRLYGVAFGITLDQEEASEILQEVFLKVYQKIHTFREEAELSTWLHRITINQSLNWQRKWKRRFKWQHRSLDEGKEGDLGGLESKMDHPEELCQRKELEEVFHRKLEELPEDARTALVLKEMEGLSYDEIARIMKIKRGTVSSRLFYARQRLRELLKDYVDEK